ncbi:unnamed protein product [Phytophthora lilii]|uniref:Unnamed protein product n=1 Tax=Phytophthora lilii TaxID=2077276 RepID=A0A9W6TDT6_9STRA|nr:unnamed protein product [Phytophthora lilii]
MDAADEERGPLLDQLEALRRQLESATKKLGEGVPDVAQVAVKQEQQDADLEQAKALAKQLLQEQELDQAVHQLKQLSRLLPHLEEVDEKKGKWWTKHMHKAVSHVGDAEGT